MNCVRFAPDNRCWHSVLIILNTSHVNCAKAWSKLQSLLLGICYLHAFQALMMSILESDPAISVLMILTTIQWVPTKWVWPWSLIMTNNYVPLHGMKYIQSKLILCRSKHAGNFLDFENGRLENILLCNGFRSITMCIHECNNILQ